MTIFPLASAFLRVEVSGRVSIPEGLVGAVGGKACGRAFYKLWLMSLLLSRPFRTFKIIFIFIFISTGFL